MRGSVKYVCFGLIGASLTLLFLLYVAGIANLSMRGFATGVVKVLPIMLVVGSCIGLVAALVKVHGCLTMLVAGCSALIAAFATAIAEPARTPVSHISVPAYVTGITIGSMVGLFVLGVAWLAQRSKQP